MGAVNPALINTETKTQSELLSFALIANCHLLVLSRFDRLERRMGDRI
jgi:hypothetical protein